MKDIEKKVSAIIAEDIDSPDVFTSSAITPIRDSINDAIQEVCMLTGSYTRKYHITLQENQYIYDIEMNKDHYCYVLQAWDRDNHWELERSDVKTLLMENPGWFEGRTGNQYKYFMVGFHQVGFFYIPSSSGKVIELKVLACPMAYDNDNDPIRLRDTRLDSIVAYAASEQFASRGDSNRAAEQYSRYLEMMEMMNLHPEYAERVYFQGGYKKWGNG
jgi:hypothetical protein